MADNVAITAGAGTTIATDDVSAVHFQKVKLDGGGDGATVPVIAGSQTRASSLPVTLPNDRFVTIDVDMSGTSGSYVAGDQMGTVITVTNFAAASGGAGTVHTALFIDQADAMAAFDVYFYTATVTVAADSAALASTTDAEGLTFIGELNFASFDDMGGMRLARAYTGVPLTMKTNGSANLYAQFVARATIGTISSNTQRLRLIVEQH